MKLFEEKSKVEVTAQALLGTEHKMDLDSTMAELVRLVWKGFGVGGWGGRRGLAAACPGRW